MVEILFWATLCIIFYTYCIYPLTVIFMVKMRGVEQPNFEGAGLPKVSLVVPVYNEERILGHKFKNFEKIEYPRDKIEFLFGSDGSNDRTNEMLRQFNCANTRLALFQERRGKSIVLNELVNKATGEIIVFSDANTMYKSDTVKKLVRHFSNPEVGAVCGELLLESDRMTIGGIGESSYWKYENFLKRLESNFRTILGATGGVYAIRKCLFTPLNTTKAVTDDFLIPLEIIKKGYLVKYEPEAKAFEKTAGSVMGEFKRKVRISASNFNGLSEFSQLLCPRYGFVAFALWSHKIIRWFVPFLLIVIVVSNAFLALDSEFYYIIFFLQLAFAAMGFLGYLSERFRWRIGFLGFPYYFISMNAALFIGFLKFVFSRQKPTWEIVRF